MNAICLVIDGLHVGYLGPYGNSWVDTPNLDRLAARSLVFDAAFIDSPDVDSLCGRLWSGRHALDNVGGDTAPATLPDRLREASVSSTLLSDAADFVAEATLSRFDDVIQVPFTPPAVPAADISRTTMASVFAAAADWLVSARPPYFLSIHSSGLKSVWDGPLALRNAFVDEGELDPPDTVAPVAGRFDKDHDPDEMLAVRRIYAGQIKVVDACLGGFLDVLDSAGAADETLLILTSSGGYPLGEHGQVGYLQDSLFGERVQIPFIMQLPQGRGGGSRSPALVQTTDLAPTLLDFWNLAPHDRSRGTSLLPFAEAMHVEARDRLVIGTPGGTCAVRTEGWYLIDRSGDETDGSPQLFAKPDDRWEQNDVAHLCREIVDDMRTAMHQWSNQEPDVSLQPIDEKLTGGFGR